MFYPQVLVIFQTIREPSCGTDGGWGRQKCHAPHTPNVQQEREHHQWRDDVVKDHHLRSNVAASTDSMRRRRDYLKRYQFDHTLIPYSTACHRQTAPYQHWDFQLPLSPCKDIGIDHLKIYKLGHTHDIYLLSPTTSYSMAATSVCTDPFVNRTHTHFL